LTSGILDAAVVGNALIRHLKRDEPEDIITRALESRRKTWLEVADPTSSSNYLRLCSEDENISEQRAEFFARMNSHPAFALGVVQDQFRLLPDAFEE
jgi:hypothetical protein